MEELRLKNGKKFTLAVNGIRETRNPKALVLEIVIPDSMTLEEVKAEFSVKEAVKEIAVEKNGTTVMIYEGYEKLGSRMALDTHAAVGVDVTENEDGTTETNTKYEAVAELELMQQPLEEKVEENRADIDFLLMMGE